MADHDPHIQPRQPADTPAAPVRRSSTEKQPVVVDDPRPSSFERLPEEIIEQILRLTDPNSFGSLVLLNSKWRAVSQQAHLYAHHLDQCPSYAASHKGRPAPTDEDSLPELRRLFAREVKRNLYNAYLRPSLTVIKLVSNSISSSSCPGGEGMQFHSSPKGHHLLAYNSSRIYVIDARGTEIVVKRELKILRRPAATCIMDDGSILAVLLTEMQVDLYDLQRSPPKRTQSIILDNSPRAIALSPCGTVLAAAYEGGIEVSSLNPGAMATDRRSVKCDAVDALAFSFDGTQILGTTVHAAQPNTVILTAPYYDPGSHMESDNISALWTTSILFPNTSRDCSHAVLLQDSSCEEASWALTYDRSFETFRAVRIDDLRNGTTYFTGPVPSQDSQARLIPCTLPAASYHGDLVAAGFQGKDIWVYGVPEDLDAVPDQPSLSAEGSPSIAGLHRRPSGPPVRSPPGAQDNSEERVPQWQLLCDKLRNTFVAGSKVAELGGVSTVKWVAGFGGSSLKERLVVAAKGLSAGMAITEEDNFDFADGGRLTLIDFDYGIENGKVAEITIEVGNNRPEVLEEETRDMETEVAIVRRRTVAQRRGNQSSVMRAATTAAPRVPHVPVPPVPKHTTEEDDAADPLLPRRIGVPPVPRGEPEPLPRSPDDDGNSMLEAQEALEDPYSHTGPRSGGTLRRAATAAANHRRLNPAPATAGPVQYRRADGRAEHPHESDADNWVPPPPPYQKEEPVVDLPSFMRHQGVPVKHPPVPPLPSQISQVPRRAQVPQPPLLQTRSSSATQAPQANTALVTRQGPPQRLSSHDGYLAASHQRQGSGSTVGGISSSDADATQLSSIATGLGLRDNDNIYDVSPPGTPHMTRPRVSSDSNGLASVGSDLTSSTHPVPTPSPVVSSIGQDTPITTAPTFTPSTIANTPAVQQSGPPVLDLQIPSSGMSPPQRWNTMDTSTSGQASAGPTMVRNSQTWPRSGPPAVEAPDSAHPQSAPAITFDKSQALDQPAQAGNRQSGVFQVARVPVGSRDAKRRMSTQLQPNQPQPPPQPATIESIEPPELPRSRQVYTPSQHPLQQNPITPRQYHARPYQPPQPPPVETDQPEMPLIISTPSGISGAFDPPGNTNSEPRIETPIVAPVPRHPRVTEGSDGQMRPTVERLEGMYNSSSSINRGNQQQWPNIGLGVSMGPPPAPPSSTGGTPRFLSRKKSRAERSAARNMSDAKKRGWRKGNGKKGGTADQGDEAASTAVWTEITAPPAGVLGPESTANSAASAYKPRSQSRLSKYHNDKNHKCVVM